MRQIYFEIKDSGLVWSGLVLVGRPTQLIYISDIRKFKLLQFEIPQLLIMNTTIMMTVEDVDHCNNHHIITMYHNAL